MISSTTTIRGLVIWAALLALSFLGLATGWSEAFFGWALNALAELTIPGYAEWNGQ